MLKHVGWNLIGNENPHSVADHTTRAAQIGFILAKMENYKDPHEVSTMVVFHDMEECRVGDYHKVANRYIRVNKLEVVKEQTIGLGEIGKEIREMWEHVENKDTAAGKIAKDADLLETAFAAKEYMEKGYKNAEDWIKNVRKRLITESALKLVDDLANANSNDWWQGLKEIPDVIR
ncbi:MAG: Metal dependent phosphohydrolase [candidate division CPR2 bacterium GW2011_GWC1_41_48]|uniref:5'-deoxynucleotidase n=1 Tax=candidate division CPR2 bacterium GW2011_GWC1_41_48 TaxID=1618344 RepID=A0A0G0W9S7_UNCC2|nr:MAG: Metal dependent phosphohydrolase [candidate division CPR2 bacterium GW2011_GWC2_39_35]KKR28560.1 MAG: Metal dependent phosphohydrolase [candidate division CPR2 bacterium GW2011_GWD1_39_7]KKR29415.1 MAG: Metal dependent phosphohydrolase [candidate division CPR2 bacterium GW2011_GWD2_39_7]KKS09754.1 MAG: Metal dependent phosphohydrolase [candidate division CPR2 bacterium GW2011_GWC1_41_48]